MNIGLTYDLCSDYLALGYTEDETAEFDRDDTITAIESALQVLGYKTERIGNARKLTEYLVICKELLYQYHQPALVEKYLSGREFTVGIVGTGKNAKLLGTLEVLLLDGAEKNVYSYFNKEHCEKLVEYHLGFPENDNAVQEAENLALKIWRILGCRDGGRVDLRCDEHGEPFFLEVNPLPGLHPEHSDLPILCNKLGISYVELINQIVTSAISRLPVKKAW